MARFGDAYKRLIVRELDDFIRGDNRRGWTLTFQQLADRCEIDEKTCRRKVAQLVAERIVSVEDTAPGSPVKRFYLGYTNIQDYARPRAKTRRGRRSQGHGAPGDSAIEVHGAPIQVHGAPAEVHGAPIQVHGAPAPLLAHNRPSSAQPPRGEVHGAPESGESLSVMNPELPAALAASPAFVAAWDAWLEYRRERRISTRRGCRERQLAFLAEFEPSVAAAMLHQSMRNDWQGIFELREQGGNHAASREERRQHSNFEAFAEFLHEG